MLLIPKSECELEIAEGAAEMTVLGDLQLAFIGGGVGTAALD